MTPHSFVENDDEAKLLSMFINMRQHCGHWKNLENQFFLQNDQFFTKGVEIVRKHLF